MGRDGVLGVVLAGGRSSRMGRDKADLFFGEERFLDRMVRLLREAGGAKPLEVVVSGCLGQIPDFRPGLGPLGGLASVLGWVERRNRAAREIRELLVVPVDMPDLSVRTLRELIVAGRGQAACHFKDQELPLLLGVSPELSQVVNELIEPGVPSPARSLRALLSRLRTRVLPCGNHRFLNVNNPEDLAALGSEATSERTVLRWSSDPADPAGSGAPRELRDPVAIEEPLEVRVAQSGNPVPARSIAITMRTPGHDRELAVGYLHGEGVVSRRSDVVGVESGPSHVRVDLAPGHDVDWKRLDRSRYVTSSCGVCGKKSIEGLLEGAHHADRNGPGSGPFVEGRVLLGLPDRLRLGQDAFARTGGVHAAGLFTTAGEPLCIREDVGRHNALDKVLGQAFLEDGFPLDQAILALSGRVSFELMQKASVAGIRVIAAVGAPSTLAVDVARELDITLAGFVRPGRFNLYHGAWRIVS